MTVEQEVHAIADLFSQVTGKQAKSIKKCQITKDASADIGNAASAEPVKWYYGRLHGTVKMSSDNDKIGLWFKGVKGVEFHGGVTVGYTGPTYQPIESALGFYSAITFTNASTDSRYLFIGWEIDA